MESKRTEWISVDEELTPAITANCADITARTPTMKLHVKSATTICYASLTGKT